jgi:hypothetical protein
VSHTSAHLVTSIGFRHETSGGQLTSMREPAAMPGGSFAQGPSSRIGLPFPLNGRPHRNPASLGPQPLFSGSTPKSIATSCCIDFSDSILIRAPHGRPNLRADAADRQRPCENREHSRSQAARRTVRKNRNPVSGNSPTRRVGRVIWQAARTGTPRSTTPGARRIAQSRCGCAGRASR